MSEEEIAFVEVDIDDGRERTYGLLTCPEGHLHALFPHSDGETGTELVFRSPEAVYEFAQNLLRGYDELVGITPPMKHKAL